MGYCSRRCSTQTTLGAIRRHTLIQGTAEIQLDRASLTGGVLPVKDEGYSSRFP